MPKYDFILLDADGTVLDFQMATRQAFFRVFREMGLPADEGTLALYNEINESYWRAVEQSLITKEKLTTQRFFDLFERLGIECDVNAVSRLYIEYLGEGSQLLEEAADVCKVLAECCTLAIATNGISQVQRNRLGRSEIRPYLSHLIISEDAGAAKPDRRFFEYAVRQCGAPDTSRVVMVGDSLSADIAGAMAFGIDSVWYNPQGVPLPEKYTPTAVITRLRDLIPYICPAELR